jgi:hypothetical protein
MRADRGAAARHVVRGAECLGALGATGSAGGAAALVRLSSRS